jgi:hypothetical protein
MVLALAAPSIYAGCGDDSDSEDGPGAGDESSPVYVLTTTVFDDTSSATYVALVDSAEEAPSRIFSYAT